MISLRTSSFVLVTMFALGCSSSSSDGTTDPTGGGAGTSGTAGTSGATGGSPGTGGMGTAGKGGATTGGAGGSTGGTSAAGMGGSGTGGTTGGAAGTGTAGKGGGAAGTAGKGGAGGSSSTANTSFDTAETIMYDDGTGANLVASTIETPATQANFWKFTGKKGDTLFLFTQCKPQADPYDPTYLDLVMTVFNDQKVQIANDDDSTGTNDPSIYTVLPADGTYYVRVQECNAWDKGGAANCSPVANITNKDFGLDIVLMDGKAATDVPEVEPNDMAANATKLKYAPAMTAGQYYTTVAYGGFSSAADVDVYSFTLPANTMITTGRATGYFNWFASGPDGSGSTTQFGEATIIDPMDPMHAVAKIPDGSLATELSPPLTLGKPYLLTVKRGATMGNNDFYFVTHNAFGSNPLETEKAPGANDTIATAETTKAQDNADGSQTFFIEGDITTPADVDFYAIPVKSGLNSISVFCGAEGSGSGLRMTKAEVQGSDGTPVAGGSGVDSFDKGINVKAVKTPAGATSVAVKISSPSVDPTVTSTFYRCGINVSKM
jgi:hypothetical protein